MEVIKTIGLFIGGIIGGLYASSVGGGALIGFPLLIFFGLQTSNAIATQRFSAVILEIVSAVKFYREKQLNIKLGLLLGLSAIVGSFLGSKLLLSFNEKALNITVGIVLLIVAIVVLYKDRLGIKEKKLTQTNYLQLFFFTFLLSIYGGFFGAGFGIFIMLLLVFFGLNYLKGAAVGRIVGFFMSVTSAIVFAKSGLINYSYGLSLGLGFAIGSWIGIGIAVKRGNEFVRNLLMVIVLLTIAKLLIGIFNIKIF